MSNGHGAPAPDVLPRIEALLARYDVFFLDAYGVLVNSNGALPGAATFLESLAERGKPYWLLSNDASRSIDTTWKRYTGFGLPVARERIITSGSLLGRTFQREGLVGQRCIVLGTDDSRAYVEAAGGIVAPPDDRSATVCVLADDYGYPFLETMNEVITVLLHRLEHGQTTRLLLPNPDLVFPRTGGFGLTAGAIAAAVEAVLRLRDPSGSQRFVPLGKPYLPIFEAGLEKVGGAVPKARILMLGDQLATDILGATRAGIASALLLTGVSRLAELAHAEAQPTHVVERL
ncbi:MAG: HAD hydrolase-like protein [Myxococcales bacterium]|nr:HAD hydrolase-like protein [Myxococcales bacterium]